MDAPVSCRLVTLAAVVYYPLAVLLGWLVVINDHERSLAMEHAANLQTLGSKASYAGDTLLEAVTFGWYAAASETDADYEASLAIADICGQRTTLAAWWLAGLTAIFCLLVQAGGQAGTATAARQAARQASLVSLVLFAVGVAATALSFVTSREMTGLGTVVFNFESKSIASTITDLLSSHDILLGGLVLLFSIIVPLGKATLVLYAAAAHGSTRDRAVRLVHIIGRWSMADVFVVAILLAMLALGRDPAVRAATGPGLYFFASYCVTALWAAAWLPGYRLHR